MSDELEQAVESEAAEVAADVAEDVAEIAAEAAVEEAVAEATEEVVEEVRETLEAIEEIAEAQEEDEQWLRLRNEILASEERIKLAILETLGSSSPMPEETLTEEQLETAEALEDAVEGLEETEAEVLEFDPEAVGAEEGSPEAPAAGRRRVRGLRRRG